MAHLLAFFIALSASLMLVVTRARPCAARWMVDLPGPRKVHLTPIPLLGGLAMYAAVVIAVLFAFNGPARAQIVGILIGATLVAGVGILDDQGLLHHQVKLFVGNCRCPRRYCWSAEFTRRFSAARGGAAGFSGRRSHGCLGGGIRHRSASSITWTACAQAVAAGLSFSGHAGLLERPNAGYHAGCRRSRRRHRVISLEFKTRADFMGDGGAMFLGYFDATLGLKLRLENSNHLSAWLCAILILGVTIFDTTLVTISPLAARAAAFATPGKDHAVIAFLI